MNWRSSYQRWEQYENLDPNLRTQLLKLQDDPKTLADCFLGNLEFGTGGMRGEMGPGTNRVNLYTIRKASEGLSRYVKASGDWAIEAGVVIAYDSRHHSAEFAREAAQVIGHHGIRVYLFEQLCPTPLLSFAVRYFQAFGGIVITASHNPPEYNGFKVYGPDGGQITPQPAKQLMTKVNEVDDELKVGFTDLQTLKQQGCLQLIGSEVMEAYLEQLHSMRIQPVVDQITIVFSPLHGTTLEPIRNGLQRFGYQHVFVVPEQSNPDPNFSTVTSPNPEDPAAFQLAIQYGKAHKADLILTTDPDGDRLGVAARQENGEYLVLNGNQIGVLLLSYWLSMKQSQDQLPKESIVLKTIVTSEMGREIAASFGIQTIDTLTGFKYIGEKATEFEQTGSRVFLFGYEESNGYLLYDFVRDKDAIQAALVMADVCSYCHSQGKSVWEALQSLYERYGYYQEALYSITLKGAEGTKKITDILSALRENPLNQLMGKKAVLLEDYLTKERTNLLTQEVTPLSLPESNLLKYWLEDESWFCIRPSGTEPKLKIYFGVKGNSSEDSQERLSRLQDAVIRLIHQ
ncbi:phospho-sugar mutase [Brevibacillus ginsengisoli]|uniref:phospho-sugar mutase n=1 Tax=Brevibacillus ginsengisoli TaxID=363854 RepID=UPI003CF50D34